MRKTEWKSMRAQPLGSRY